jgi:pantoate--beta-alanine ligase
MPDLAIVRTVKTLREAIAPWRAGGKRVALAPTMGALHAGHLSLIQIAKAQAEVVVASLFVNPLQFAPSEDFAAYPRDEVRDAALLAQVGCDLLYCPTSEEMYGPGFQTEIRLHKIAQDLEGAIRPDHFAGVATVVAKLLLQTSADVAVFGEKDYQQFQLVRQLVRDLDFPTQIIPAPIVRAEDGLALSSRNAYLTAEQRRIAPALFAALVAAKAALARGEDTRKVERGAREHLLAAGFDAVDYVETRSTEGFEPLPPGPAGERARLLAAARLGRTRLLDNIEV